MGLGHRNECLDRALNGTHLKRVREESDLGVIICGDLKSNRQCGKAAVRANQVLGIMHRTFSNRNRGVMMKLYKALVRPHLEYCVPGWRPHLWIDWKKFRLGQTKGWRVLRDRLQG